MTENKTTPLARETIEDWIKRLDGHEVPAWITEHLQRYMASGEQGHMWDASNYGGYANTPSLLLTTIGRKSGKPVTVPLLYGTSANGSQVVVGSKGGAPEHPVWYRNIIADPHVTVQVAERHFNAIARTTGGDERAQLWQMLIGVYPPLADYQKQTTRELPVVVLESA